MGYLTLSPPRSPPEFPTHIYTLRGEGCGEKKVECQGQDLSSYSTESWSWDHCISNAHHSRGPRLYKLYNLTDKLRALTCSERRGSCAWHMAQIWCSNLVLRHQCPHWMIFQTQTAVATGVDREWKHDMSAPDDLCILECNCCVWKKKTTNFVKQRFQSWTTLTQAWNLTLDVFLELSPTS